MRKVLLIAVWVVACSASTHKQGLTGLKRELSQAQRELSMAQMRVLELEEAIAYQEVARIEHQIQKIVTEETTKLLHSREERLAFFHDQRETLVNVIRSYPTCAPRAQEVLDQILTLITQVSDEE